MRPAEIRHRQRQPRERLGDTGAIASHLTTGRALHEIPILLVMTLLTAASWVLRAEDRLNHRSG